MYCSKRRWPKYQVKHQKERDPHMAVQMCCRTVSVSALSWNSASLWFPLLNSVGICLLCMVVVSCCCGLLHYVIFRQKTLVFSDPYFISVFIPAQTLSMSPWGLLNIMWRTDSEIEVTVFPSPLVIRSYRVHFWLCLSWWQSAWLGGYNKGLPCSVWCATPERQHLRVVFCCSVRGGCGQCVTVLFVYLG